MITLSRRQARRLRAVFRRSVLGITNRGHVPPLVLRADPGAGLRVRHHQPHLAVECLLPNAVESGESLAVPLEALADVEGRADSPVVLEAVASNRTVARWEDRGIPQVCEYAVPAPLGLPPFPEPPAAFASCSEGLLDALAAAGETGTDDSTRYALNCIQLRAGTFQVIATDGHQILAQGGFRFPWEGDRLIRRSPLFTNRELPRDRPIEVGESAGHIVLRAGSWTIALAVQTEARFPRVDEVITATGEPRTRLRLAPEDARFLVQALDRLPGAEEHNTPVTVDLNGRVAVRARAEGQDRPTELILCRSGFTGPPVRLNTNRAFLARALGLGFMEVQVFGPSDPLYCREGLRSYVWQPLDRESSIEPADDAIRIESLAADPSTPPVGTTRGHATEDEPAARTRPQAAPEGPGPRSGPAHGNGVGGNSIAQAEVAANGKVNGIAHGNGANGNGACHGSGATGLSALIQEAEELHRTLADAQARSRRLLGGLRRQRKQARLMSSTLATLKQLRLQDVAP
jgi:hypothetical protein